VIGLLAAARGLRRTDELTEFFGLRFGVRIDQPGKLVRDFQTARSLDGRRSMPLSYRYYLADAVFLAAIEGDDQLLHGLAEALRRPVYPLYLGRRSCPPAGPISLGVRTDLSMAEVLDGEPWLASTWHQRNIRSARVRLPVLRDAESSDENVDTIRDEPLSFDPSRREYGWRTIVHGETYVDNPQTSKRQDPMDHDPMAALGG
jgi:CRISPR system Cascade subunit CasD